MSSPRKRIFETAERRRYERISTGLDTLLAVAVVLPDGTECPTKPIDMSSGGVGLLWPLERQVVIDVGQRVTLHIHPRTSDVSAMVHATVRWLSADNTGNIHCGLEFEDVYEIFEHVMPTLWQLCHALHGRR
jgi:c-di-GMP-binding flagellar brake protein YcgR